MRVVSLLPSATELCYGLGVEPVGVSHECDYPNAASELPVVIRSRIDADASSADIDEQVQEATVEGGVYEIDRETLARLDPDVIISQGMCDVCAVDDAAIRAAVADLDLDADVVTTDPHSLADLFDDIDRLGTVLDRDERAAELIGTLRERVEEVTRSTPDDGPRVAVLDWLDPVMVAGHWIPEMIDSVGAGHGLADPGDRSTPREWQTIREYDPEILVAAPCGFGVDQTLENTADLTDREGWSELSAVQSGAVYIMDGHHYVNRPGPRLVDTLELIADVVHGTVEDTDAVIRWPDRQQASTEKGASQ